MRLIFTLPFFLILVSSCKKETVFRDVEVPQRRSWSLDSSVFGQTKILTNSVRLNDSMFAVAGGNALLYLKAGKFNASTTGAYFNLRETYGQFPRLSMDSLISVFPVSASRLDIVNTSSPVYDRNRITYNAPFSNEAESVKAYPGTQFRSRSYPIINSRYILAPFEINYSRRKASAVLIRVSLQSAPFTGELSLDDSKAVALTPTAASPGFSDGVYFSDTYFGKFFLSLGNQFYRIDTLGNVKSFGSSVDGVTASPAPRTMFRLGEQLCALANGKFFLSADKGETWKLFADVASSAISNLSYQNLGDEAYAFTESQVWHVTLRGASLNFEELDMDGLQTNTITSLVQAGKYTYVTTLAGLYYRETELFHSPRKN